MENRKVISAIVENKPGVLARVAGMFSGRSFNIDSLSVAPTMNSDLSQMTMVTHGNEAVFEQIIKQLRKLINISKVQDLTRGDYVDRELVLVKIKATSVKRGEALRIVEIFRAGIVDVATDNLTIEVTGSQGKIESMLELLSSLGILEVVRTGTVAIPRGRKVSRTGDTGD